MFLLGQRFFSSSFCPWSLSNSFSFSLFLLHSHCIFSSLFSPFFPHSSHLFSLTYFYPPSLSLVFYLPSGVRLSLFCLYISVFQFLSSPRVLSLSLSLSFLLSFYFSPLSLYLSIFFFTPLYLFFSIIEFSSLFVWFFYSSPLEFQLSLSLLSISLSMYLSQTRHFSPFNFLLSLSLSLSLSLYFTRFPSSSRFPRFPLTHKSSCPHSHDETNPCAHAQSHLEISVSM